EVMICRRLLEGQDERPQLSMERLEIEKEEPLEAEIEAFIECVRSRKRPMVSGQEGREALRVALEILKEIHV
ncbi:MAG: hypothetical protein L0Y56_04440, partial [Nitrospira sp.]|nr:hypothetical protein [Nitrospira sp.]